MNIIFTNKLGASEVCTVKVNPKKPVILELDFDNDMFTLRQDGLTTVSGELSTADIISFQEK